MLAVSFVAATAVDLEWQGESYATMCGRGAETWADSYLCNVDTSATAVSSENNVGVKIAIGAGVGGGALLLVIIVLIKRRYAWLRLSLVRVAVREGGLGAGDEAGSSWWRAIHTRRPGVLGASRQRSTYKADKHAAMAKGSTANSEPHSDTLVRVVREEEGEEDRRSQGRLCCAFLIVVSMCLTILLFSFGTCRF